MTLSYLAVFPFLTEHRFYENVCVFALTCVCVSFRLGVVGVCLFVCQLSGLLLGKWSHTHAQRAGLHMGS